MSENCLKCKHLKELFERTPKSDRDYWLMTELFVLLHGADFCEKATTKLTDILQKATKL